MSYIPNEDIIVVEDITTATTANVVAYTFIVEENSGYNIIVDAVALRDNSAQLNTIIGTAGFYRTGSAAPTLVSAGAFSTLSRTAGAAIGISLGVNGNNIELLLNSGATRNMVWNLTIKILKTII